MLTDRLATRLPAEPLRRFVARSRTTALTLLAIAALGIGGIATASNSAQAPGPADPGSTAADRAATDRAAAAQRADRGTRTQSAVPGTAASSESGLGAAGSSPDAGTTEPGTTEPGTGSAAQADTAATSAAETESPSPASSPTPSPAPDWVTPLPGAQTTSCYGLRWGVLHAGIDLAMPAGTPVLAAGAGTVQVAGWAYTGYGISVVIDHGNGVLTHYAHLSATEVSVGDQVKPGQAIGAEGSTGDSTGPHLHFEVHLGLWNQIDPAPWMRERGVDLGC
ncbi:M23 family metallopeptidase [Solwaraspora sp. WMMB335]|uniref:M23 family metallopeptidase n=1 Tax=Solwaraspora sp. WMMB335 TaxID=3404118 RepID=UPI003B952B62